MRSKHDIKNLTASSYSVPLKTPKTKLEVPPPKDVEGDTLLVKTTLSRQIFPQGLAKILLGTAMDPILNFQKIHTFASLMCTVFELWLFVLRHVATPQNRLYPPLMQV